MTDQEISRIVRRAAELTRKGYNIIGWESAKYGTDDPDGKFIWSHKINESSAASEG